ncbi:hypothetical protein [Deinococcus sp.]|uniref:hypothetical protein n=1 Tax=Deinococcus sp. TaxID=47478 RepID=UPI0025BD4942|nr:hypothetical protein [Deinococcus sp.]
MPPEFLRPLLSLAGLGIGYALYQLAHRLGEPWQSVAVGALFVLLGGAAWVYAAGERWIQVLAALLLVWGVLRAVLLH